MFDDQFSRMKVEEQEGSNYVKVNMGPFEVKALTLVDASTCELDEISENVDSKAGKYPSPLIELMVEDDIVEIGTMSDKNLDLRKFTVNG